MISGRHPITLLSLLGLLVLIALLSPWWWATGSVLVLVLAVGAAPPHPTRAMIISAGTALGLSLLVQGSLVGLESGAVLGTRVALLVAAGLLIGSALAPGDLMTLAIQLHAGPRIGYVLAAAVAALPRMRRRAAEISVAQQARGLPVQGTLRQRGRALLALAGPLVVSVIEQNDERAAAMETRGLGGTDRFHAYRQPVWPVSERIVTAAVATAGLLLVVLTALATVGR